jgi:hypothetical protein
VLWDTLHADGSVRNTAAYYDHSSIRHTAFGCTGRNSISETFVATEARQAAIFLFVSGTDSFLFTVVTEDDGLDSHKLLHFLL